MRTALVIEDNEDNMVLITFILDVNGFAIETARTGLEGIAKIAAKRPDFVLLDIQLPDIDGFEVLRRLRDDEATRELPVIAVTSYAMAGDRSRILAAGCTGYIEKPIDPERFISQVKQVIGQN